MYSGCWNEVGFASGGVASRCRGVLFGEASNMRQFSPRHEKAVSDSRHGRFSMCMNLRIDPSPVGVKPHFTQNPKLGAFPG